MTREIPPLIQERFEWAKNTPSDINEHLERLRELASECEHITEFGVRSGMSTTAFLAGQPTTLISWDINPLSIYGQSVASLMALSLGTRTAFQPRVGDTLKISPIEPTDLLFIDSLHTAKQLKAELERHVDPMRMPVKKYLVFHDTVTFGMKGEDGSTPGLRGVIRWFQRCHTLPQWELLEDRQNNNGLVILKAATP